MKSVNIRERKKKSKPPKKMLLFAILFSVVGTLIYFLVTNRAQTVNAIQFVVSRNRREINYQTYKTYLEGIGEKSSEEIKSELGEIQYDDIERFSFVEDREEADIILSYGTGDNVIYSQYLLPIGHLYWTEDSVSINDIKYGEYTVLLNQEGYRKYSEFLKSVYPDIEIEESGNLISDLEDEACGCIGLLENTELSKEYKLLKIDDKYYLDTFDAGVEVSLVAESNMEELNIQFVSNIVKKNLGLTEGEFNKDTIAKVNMTGVTALTRRVAKAMDVRNDYDYPAEKIANFLSDADITHTSNEISFVPGCTSYSGMRFCSNPQSIETLKAIGADVIELTGNHNNDYGSQYNTETIEAYKEEGWGYFGGGLNSEDAREVYITEVDGSKIAFLGYNYYDAVVAGGTNALAGSSKAGANPYSESRMREDIESVRDEVDIVIVDFQYQECYSYPSSDVIYPVCYRPIGSQSNVFRKAVDFGADIVVGTQAHQPQTYELYGEGVIFYGLGNLFFDQSMWIGTRQGMILTHYFREGELIQTKITPTIYDSSLQVEVATEDDAELLLDLLDTARGSL
jgi:poly-gamma-glutamate capsule biosynthesis protein CapA/YwtB (metallophosphatase superfamily)